MKGEAMELKTDRRSFLKGTAWMGAAAFAAGCCGPRFGFGAGGSMYGFACAPLKRVRIGLVGIGGRGTSALKRLCQIPGCAVVALCDLRPERIDACNKLLAEAGCACAKGYCGPEAYKALCDSDTVDAIYIAGNWQMHCPVGHYAVAHGKHTFIEVPSAFTLDQCWEFVELAEKHRVHCMQLENCCYGEAELLCLNLCRMGKLGELVHGEAAYIHDLRGMNYADDPTPGISNRGYYGHWRLKWNAVHGGNQYPTHGLGPVCQCMGINRGDRFDCLCSMDSKQANFEAYGRANWPAGDWHHEQKVRMGDMNTTVIRTALGRTIMLQHDVSSPRPYTRLNLVSGTRGVFRGGSFTDEATVDFGVRFGWEETSGAGVHKFFAKERMRELRREFAHPYWKTASGIAQKVGGHGGMDFLMDLRWAYCLQNGLPMDMDVYDLASWCSICELSETSSAERRYVDVPDFTRGAWRTNKPLGIVDVDMSRLDFRTVRRDENQMNV